VLMSIGGLVGGFFYETVSPMLPFVSAFIVTVPCTAITMLLVHEPKQKET